MYSSGLSFSSMLKSQSVQSRIKSTILQVFNGLKICCVYLTKIRPSRTLSFLRVTENKANSMHRYILWSDEFRVVVITHQSANISDKSVVWRYIEIIISLTKLKIPSFMAVRSNQYSTLEKSNAHLQNLVQQVSSPTRIQGLKTPCNQFSIAGSIMSVETP